MSIPNLRSKRAILIATSNLDYPIIEPVVRKLSKRGWAHIVYEADLVAAGKKHMAVHVGEHGLSCVYDGHVIHNDAIAAAWLRRPGNTGPLYPNEDHAYRLWLDRERITTQNAIWEIIAGKKWLNAPGAIKSAENKVNQLALAQSLGFVIPETVISNSRTTIADIIKQDMTLKMHQGLVTTKDGYSSHYSAVIPYNPHEKPAGLPYPGIWQPYIPKAKEWRITVVGDQVFDAAIYTKDKARADWRRHQATSLVSFKSETFPDKQKTLCKKMLSRLGLRYGAFDFIERPDGTIVFLELNPNGQYAWLEHVLGLAISDAIAALLIDIAERKSK